MTALLGLIAFLLAVACGFLVTFFLQAKAEVRATKQEMVRVEQQARADLARYQGIADLESYQSELKSQIRSAREVLPRFQSLADMEQYRAKLAAMLTQYEQASAQWQQQVATQQATLNHLVTQTRSVEENLEMQAFGFYRTKYDFDSASHYARQIDVVRDQQKAMVKSEQATHCPQEWTVDGSRDKGRKMVNEHAKLMLRAFNGECDAAIAKVKYNNVNNLENRINRSFDAINKLGESKSLWITGEYQKLKLQELYLVHEHAEKVQMEREEQQRIKEQMREEEKALREIEKAQQEAERDEASRTNALDKARQELAESQGNQTDRLEAIVRRLEAELADALERKERAIARAQLTRSGHVYVLSNIGSFGEGVYKIGMTRRLDPNDRVRELGDASVPFQYDVHAMIYCDDAPGLERLLHEHFAARRVNMANVKREFFRVTLDEIRVAVEHHHGVITFVAVPEAEEYRRTHSILDELKRSMQLAS